MTDFISGAACGLYPPGGAPRVRSGVEELLKVALHSARTLAALPGGISPAGLARSIGPSASPWVHSRPLLHCELSLFSLKSMFMDDTTYNDKLIVGRKERIAFPRLNRSNIVARIDSGARSSSAHCDKIWLETLGGEKVLCCRFLKRSKRVTRFKKFKKRKVKSSNGTIQTRYVVRLEIQLGRVNKRTDITLTDRSTMNYSVLLGRRFLMNDFLIDVSRSYVQHTKESEKE